MTREVESNFWDFCARQRSHFSRGDWLRLPAEMKDYAATTALFLASTEWYGHHLELERIAEALHPGCAGHFVEMAKANEFQMSRFSSMLRTLLRHEGALA